MKRMLSKLLNHFGYYKLPPRYACQVMAAAQPDHLTEYGISQLPKWQDRRQKAIDLWAAKDEWEGLNA